MRLTDFQVTVSDDPLRFAHDAIDWTTRLDGTLRAGPEEWQGDVLEDVWRRLLAGDRFVGEAVASGNGVGATTLLAWLALWNLLTSEDSRSVLTAATEGQLFGKLWPEVLKWWGLLTCQRGFNIKDGFEVGDRSIVCTSSGHEGWRLDCLPLRGPEALAGLEAAERRLFVGFDEAALIGDLHWKVVEGAFESAGSGVWAAFGVPYDRATSFGRRFDGEIGWSCRHVDSKNYPRRVNPAVTKRWEEDYGADSDFVKVRVRGEFPEPR